MRFLVDAQLPPALARWLGEHSFSATPVREVGLRESDDGSIWNFATGGRLDRDYEGRRLCRTLRR